MILYRPVDVGELRLLAQSGFRAFPPRLPDQPIFYPVLTLEYARRIARDWNTPDAQSGYAGFVTRFEIDDITAQRYPVQIAGAACMRNSGFLQTSSWTLTPTLSESSPS